MKKFFAGFSIMVISLTAGAFTSVLETGGSIFEHRLTGMDYECHDANFVKIGSKYDPKYENSIFSAFIRVDDKGIVTDFYEGVIVSFKPDVSNSYESSQEGGIGGSDRMEIENNKTFLTYGDALLILDVDVLKNTKSQFTGITRYKNKTINLVCAKITY